MRKNLIFTFLFILISFQILAQEKTSLVFKSGDDGYKSYRIPAMITAPNGDLLAFCEGRKDGAADFGDNDIVLKRSFNKGKSWSKLELVVDYKNLQASNSAPVVDYTDPKYPKGRIFLFYNTGNAHEYDVRAGKGLRESWYITSIDNGKTWSEPINITTQVQKPNRPDINQKYNFKEDWRAYANTPGHAIQLEEGKYKGRIYIAANHSVGGPKNDFTDYFANGYYTDDHGKTFHISSRVEFPGSNESTAVELPNNGLMMNSRNQKGDIKARIVSISKDGGATWETTYVDKNLIDPVNQGSLLKIGKKKSDYIIAFSNTANSEQRNDLTIKISEDSGKTWSQSYLIAHTDDKKNDFAAYSDLVKLNNDTLGILYERENYNEIVFTTLKWRISDKINQKK